MKLLLLLSFVLMLHVGCSTSQNMPATIGLNEVKFRVDPYVSYSNGAYYLVYQVYKNEREMKPRILIGEKIKDGKFYYFIMGKTSFPEYDFIVRRPVNTNESIIKLFKAGSVYWLNPDKSEVRLKIIEE